jgi:hypothetical protein
MIVSVPMELDNDHMELMSLAQIYLGSISLDQVKDDKGWGNGTI